jgi:hypothetical protein
VIGAAGPKSAGAPPLSRRAEALGYHDEGRLRGLGRAANAPPGEALGWDDKGRLRGLGRTGAGAPALSRRAEALDCHDEGRRRSLDFVGLRCE